MNSILNITKAMADSNRLRMLMALSGGELCVCQIIELLALAPSTVSKHLSVLHQAKLVEARKEGRWMYYRLPGRGMPEAVREALAWVKRNLADTPETVQDSEKLAEILSIDRETLCKRQHRS